MGYTHYYRQHRAFTRHEWDELITRTFTIIALAEDQGIELAGWDGTGAPEITAERIAFNGARPADCETLMLHHIPFKRHPEQETAHGSCKTLHLPYDLVVRSVLAAAHRIAPDAITLESDGDDVFRNTLDEAGST